MALVVLSVASVAWPSLMYSLVRQGCLQTDNEMDSCVQKVETRAPLGDDTPVRTGKAALERWQSDQQGYS